MKKSNFLNKSKAKESLKIVDIPEEKCDESIKTAQRFNIKLRAYAGKLTIKPINEIRKKFKL